MLHYPPPTAFGLPEKFASWRQEQIQAIERSSRSTRRFVCHALPTGSGKSLVGIGLAKMAGLRVAYLTSTKGLQRQLERDFGVSGLVDIRGQNNYPCALLMDEGHTGRCDFGPCHAGFQCDKYKGGCAYYDAVREASSADMVVTNYQYWVRAHRNYPAKESPLGAFDMLILDEVHDAPDELSEALSFTIHRQDTEGLLGAAAPWHEKDDIKVWQVWAREVAPKAAFELKKLADMLKSDPHSPARRQYKLMADLDRKLASLRSCLGAWVVDQTKPHNEVKFSPVWPSYYSERLFVGIPHILLLSATVRPKTAHLLGVGDEDMDFHEYDSSFPVSLRPVVHVPTVRMNHKTDDYGLRLWLSRIDQIIGARLDRKGIIHTVSYDRRSFVMTHSEHLAIMMSHGTDNTTYTIEQFKRAKPPKVLVSPSVSTGFDFPEDFCRYQIIGKLGFIDTRNKLSKARCDSDPDYSPYIAMQQLIQACGRGVRSITDWCESIIIDDNIGWFLKRHKQFAPRWFLQAYKSLQTLPEPPDLDSMQKGS